MRYLTGLLGIVIFSVSAAVAQTRTEPPEQYCAYYANNAVRLGNIARSVSSCRHLVDEAPQRWALNYDQHFAYCMRIYGSGQGMAEDETRMSQIKFCSGP